MFFLYIFRLEKNSNPGYGLHPGSFPYLGFIRIASYFYSGSSGGIPDSHYDRRNGGVKPSKSLSFFPCRDFQKSNPGAFPFLLIELFLGPMFWLYSWYGICLRPKKFVGKRGFYLDSLGFLQSRIGNRPISGGFGGTFPFVLVPKSVSPIPAALECPTFRYNFFVCYPFSVYSVQNHKLFSSWQLIFQKKPFYWLFP